MVPLAGFTVPRAVLRRIAGDIDPGVAVVPLATLKTHLRVTHSSEDAYLATMETAARRMVERYLSVRLITRQIVQWMDCFPGNGGNSYAIGAAAPLYPVRYGNVGTFRWFELIIRPTVNVTAFEYITPADTTETFPSNFYIVDASDPDQYARVILSENNIWPVDLRSAKAIKVTYDVGYGPAAANVPPDLVHAVMLVAAALWSNRGDNLDPGTDILHLPAVKAILDPFRVRRVGTAW